MQGGRGLGAVPWGQRMMEDSQRKGRLRKCLQPVWGQGDDPQQS